MGWSRNLIIFPDGSSYCILSIESAGERNEKYDAKEHEICTQDLDPYLQHADIPKRELGSFG